jgi:subtilisin family serine protease
VGGWDFLQEDSDPSEPPDGLDNDGDGRIDEAVGHGTHVAGIVRQVAPDAQLLIARVLNSDGVGDMLDVARAIRWAVASGARVINISLGSLSYSAAVQLALDEAQAANVVVVSSAGNWGAHDPQEYPAIAPTVLAVAALDDQGLAAPFTSYGNFVSFAAPGVAIRSTFINGGYAQWSGTSMSAPFLAGGAALLLALHPDWSPQLVKQRFATTAHTVDQPIYRNQLGAGALDLGAALQAR